MIHVVVPFNDRSTNSERNYRITDLRTLFSVTSSVTTLSSVHIRLEKRYFLRDQGYIFYLKKDPEDAAKQIGDLPRVSPISCQKLARMDSTLTLMDRYLMDGWILKV